MPRGAHEYGSLLPRAAQAHLLPQVRDQDIFSPSSCYVSSPFSSLNIKSYPAPKFADPKFSVYASVSSFVSNLNQLPLTLLHSPSSGPRAVLPPTAESPMQAVSPRHPRPLDSARSTSGSRRSSFRRPWTSLAPRLRPAAAWFISTVITAALSQYCCQVSPQSK